MTPQNSLQADVAQPMRQDVVERRPDLLQALEDVRIEDEANCTIGAGYGRGALLQAKGDDSGLTSMQRQQLRILVSGEFCQMLNDCDLGAGLPEALRVGKQRLAERLKRPSEDLQKQLMVALDAVMVPDGAQGGIPDEARSQVRRVLRSVLSDEDWEAIALAVTTAIQTHIRQKVAEAKSALAGERC